jgi:hypothetical protein
MIRLSGLIDLKSYTQLREEMPDAYAEQEQGAIDDHEGEMARAQLMSIHKQSGELFNMIADGEELEGWVQNKLSLAADYISAVYNNLQYEKSNASTLGSGMGAPADVPLANNSEIK